MIVLKHPGVTTRGLMIGYIAHGRDPLIIRVASIHDVKLADAIVSGAKLHSVQVLVDESSPELVRLAESHIRRLHIRIADSSRRGRFDGARLADSFCMWIGSDGLVSVYGDVTWNANGSRSEASEIIEGGYRGFKSRGREAASFESDFAHARRLWPSR